MIFLLTVFSIIFNENAIGEQVLEGNWKFRKMAWVGQGTHSILETLDMPGTNIYLAIWLLANSNKDTTENTCTHMSLC